MTQTNTPDIDSKLGKIIETYFFVIHHSCGIDADPADGFGECTCNAEAEAKQAIKELFLTSEAEIRIDELKNWRARTFLTANDALNIRVEMEARIKELKAGTADTTGQS